MKDDGQAAFHARNTKHAYAPWNILIDSTKIQVNGSKKTAKANFSFLLFQVNLTLEKITQTFNFQLQCHVVENAEAEQNTH